MMRKISCVFALMVIAGCDGASPVSDGPAQHPPPPVDVSRHAPSEPVGVDDLMYQYMPGSVEDFNESLRIARSRPETIQCPPVERAPVLAIPLERTPTPRLAEQLAMIVVCATAQHDGYYVLNNQVRAELERRLAE